MESVRQAKTKIRGEVMKKIKLTKHCIDCDFYHDTEDEEAYCCITKKTILKDDVDFEPIERPCNATTIYICDEGEKVYTQEETLKAIKIGNDTGFEAGKICTEKRVFDDVINRFEKCRNMVDFNYALNEYIRDFGLKDE